MNAGAGRCCSRASAGADLLETSTELDAYILSGESKTITIDPTNADIISVEAGESLVSPLTTVASVSKTGNMCLIGTGAPNANYGFTGAGKIKGNWPNRTRYTSGNWTARVVFANGMKSPQVGPNSTNIFSEMIGVVGAKLR